MICQSEKIEILQLMNEKSQNLLTLCEIIDNITKKPMTGLTEMFGNLNASELVQDLNLETANLVLKKLDKKFTIDERELKNICKSYLTMKN
jgi:hypothetical protein